MAAALPLLLGNARSLARALGRAEQLCKRTLTLVPMNSQRAFGDRWWEAVGLGLLGVGVLAIQTWPTPAANGLAYLAAVGALFPILRNSVLFLLRRLDPAPAWRTGAATVGGAATAFAIVEGWRRHSWQIGALAFVIAGLLGALSVAFDKKGRGDHTKQDTAPAVTDTILLVAALGMLFGYFAALPDLRDLNEGVSWVWPRGLLWACGTWLVGGAATLWYRRSRPAA